jgi:two-component system CheB/CheR fusion protein
VPVDTGGEGLSAALERLAEHLDEIHEAQVQYRRHGVDGEALSDAAAANHLYRIAQEAATNALRHGDADRIELILSGSDRHVRLQVRDDGRGFDPEAVHAEGLGLRTMEYRARLMGAELSISSVKEKGTTVTCTLGPDGGVPSDSAPVRDVDDRSRGGCPV